MTIKYENIGPSATRLERFGLRAGENLERHGDSSPWFVPFKATLPPLVASYVAVLADVRRRNKLTQHNNRMLAEAVAAVAEDMRGYFVAVSRDVPVFDRDDYPETSVPEDVIQQSRRFVDFVRAYTNEAGESLPYAQELVARQTELADRAEVLKREAKDEMAELTARRGELHESAVALHAELVAFRQVLRKVLGPKHRDYRALRYRRGSAGAESDAGDGDLAALEAELHAQAPPANDSEAA